MLSFSYKRHFTITVILCVTLLYQPEPTNGQLLSVEYVDFKLDVGNYCQRSYYDGKDTIYLFGGCSSNTWNQIEIFNVSSDTISRRGVENMPGRAQEGTVQADEAGNVFYFGGGDEFKDVYKFDPISNQSSVVATLPVAVYGSVSVKYSSNIVYIFGGSGQNRTLLSFNLELLTYYTVTANLTYQVLHATSVQLGDKAYIFPNKNELKQVIEFDLNTLKMIAVGPATLPYINYYASSVKDDWHAYLIGGYESDRGPTNGIYQFDFATFDNTFLFVNNFPVESPWYYRYSPSSVFVEKQNRIYFFGGQSSNYTRGGWLQKYIFYIDLSPLNPEPSMPTIEPSSTTTISTTKETAMPLSSTPISTRQTTNTIPNTSATQLTASTTNITSTIYVISTTQTPGCVTCDAIDSKGRQWSICAGITHAIDCNEILAAADGQFTWTCLDTGRLATPEPDYSNCSSRWLIEYEDRVKEIKDLNSTLTFLEDLFIVMINPSANYFGHEIRNVSEMLRIATSTASSFTNDSTSFEPVVKGVVKVMGRVFSLKEPWNELESIERSILGTNLINRIETTSLTLTKKVNISSRQDYVQHFAADTSHQDTLFSSAYVTNQDGYKANGLVFPEIGPRDSVLKLPPGWSDLINTNKIESVGIMIFSEYANIMMPGQFKALGYFSSRKQASKILNGNVLGFTVGALDDDFRQRINFSGQGVQILFYHIVEAFGKASVSLRKTLKQGELPKAAMGTAECVYWDNKNEWSSEGCKVVSVSKWETICECNHLTSFAVLMQLHTYEGPDEILQLLTYVLCPISITCLFVSILIFTTIPTVQKQKVHLTRNLCICLLIGNILIVSVLNLYSSDESWCVAAGMAIHYIFLSAFCWMLLEGIHLYKAVVVVFGSENVSVTPYYTMFAFVAPFFVVVITTGIGYGLEDRPYGGEEVCWLNVEYRWSFLGPVAAIVLVNLVILSISMWKAGQFLKNRKFPLLKRSASLAVLTVVKGSFALNILLGLSWSFGFFAMIPGAHVVLYYLFVVLNASQGVFIFVFHIVLNDNMRQGIAKRYGDRLPNTVTKWLSSSSSRPNSYSA